MTPSDKVSTSSWSAFPSHHDVSRPGRAGCTPSEDNTLFLESDAELVWCIDEVLCM